MKKTADKIKHNTFEVEDIIKLALNKNSYDIQILENALQFYYLSNKQNNNTPPMDKWIKVGIEYIKMGLEGLDQFSINDNKINNDLPFVLAFIEELKTSESLELILKLLSLNPNQEQLLQIISSINQILSFKNSVVIKEEEREFLENNILSAWSDNLNEVKKATILLSLRGVGKDKSLEFINDLTELKEPWHDVKSIVKREIRKRIKA